MPNITQKRLADWSAKDLDYFLETGQTPDGDTAGGLMVHVIRNTLQLPSADRAPVAEFVKSLPLIEGPPRPKRKTDKTSRIPTVYGVTAAVMRQRGVSP